MTWSKAQLAEMKYYCTSTRCRTSFPCYPFSWQIETILEIFSFIPLKNFKSRISKNFIRHSGFQSPVRMDCEIRRPGRSPRRSAG